MYKDNKKHFDESYSEGCIGYSAHATESKIETAKRLAQMGLTIDQIAKAVDASKEDVQEWITMPLR